MQCVTIAQTWFVDLELDWFIVRRNGLIIAYITLTLVPTTAADDKYLQRSLVVLREGE